MLTAEQMARSTAIFLAVTEMISGFTTSAPGRNFLHRRCRHATAAISATRADVEGDVTVTADGVFVVRSMPPPLPPLDNDYYLLRHGQSWGNVENVISSARRLATSEEHGLTPLGYEQGMQSAENLLEMIAGDAPSTEGGDGAGRRRMRVFFYSSPFARARQTAQACLEGLAEEKNREKADSLGLDIQAEIFLEDGIMERFFGELDFAAIETYNYVWPVDMVNVTHTEYDVESVAAVATRIREALTRIDSDPRRADAAGGAAERDVVVLVSHADVLQITQLYAAGAENVGNFSSYRFANGEVRAMRRTPDLLPKPDPLQRPEDS